MKQLKISICCMLVVLMASLQANAQQNTIDSLQQALKTAKEDTNKVNILNALSKYAGWQIGDFDTASFYATQAMHIADKLGYKKGMADSYNNIGNVYNSQSNNPKALENYLLSLKFNEEIGNKQGLAGNYNNIGLVYNDWGNYPEALKYFFQALKINEAIGNKNWTAINYGNIGGIYLSQGSITEALKYFLTSLKINEEIENKVGMSGDYTNIGVTYMTQGASLKGKALQRDSLYNLSLKNFFLSLKISEEIGDKLGIAICILNIAGIYKNQGKYTEALEKDFESLKIFEEIGSRGSIANLYFDIGDIFLELGKAQDGIEWIQKGLNLSKEIAAKEAMMDGYWYLSRAYNLVSNHKEAYENYKMHILFRDSLFNEENTKKITQTQMQYEFDKKEAAAKAEQEKKDIRQRNIRNSSFAAVGALLLFSLVVVRQRNKVKKEKQRSESLLLNILPAEVADELKTKGTAAAKQFDDVTVLFTDFVNFTQTSEHLSPQQLVQELNACFTAFDEITERNGLEKIKTVGDAYIAVCGLPLSDPLHAQKAVKAALEIRNFIEERKKTQNVFEIRIGVNSGSVVAGIVGVKKFAYDIWGDTVNTAARMESNGQPGKVNISETTYRLVKDDFTCTHRGKISAKGKGEVDMYFVEKNN